MPKITPTVGRVVHYKPNPVVHPEITYAALVVGVVSEREINLAVFDQDGHHFPATNVPLVQDDEVPPQRPYAQWMPYQIGQAAKTEAAEKLAEENTTHFPPQVGAIAAAGGSGVVQGALAGLGAYAAAGVAPLPERSPAADSEGGEA